MSTTATTAKSAANAADISRRMLMLIDSIHGPEQIDAGHIERVTGIKVEVDNDNPNRYGFSGELGDIWDYNLVSLTEIDGSRPHRLMFSFDDTSAERNSDMGEVCDIDLAGYDSALIGVGFVAEPIRGHHGEIEYWEYKRGEVSLQVHARGESDERAEHACVSMIVINA